MPVVGCRIQTFGKEFSGLIEAAVKEVLNIVDVGVLAALQY
jgi:hypothetical protein